MAAATRSPHVEFRSQQAAHDLAQIAGQAQADTLAACATNPAALTTLITTRQCRFAGGDDAELYDDLLVTAASPDRGEAFFIATAVLLSNALQDGHGAQALEWFWDEFHGDYGGATPRTRAAILRGWSQLKKASGAELEPVLGDDAYIATDPAPLIDGLRALAQSMSRVTIIQVAKADYGEDTNKHETTLAKLLWEQGCELQPDQSWFPLEVIELASQTPDHPGFIECTALLLFDALTNGDRIGRMDFRWQNNAPAYRSLDDPARRLILQGFRYLYESDPNFMAFKSKDYAALGEAHLIPLF